MLLIFSDPSQGPAEDSPEAMAEWQAWGTYTQGLKDAGAFVSGEPLEAPSTATTVAGGDGARPRPAGGAGGSGWSRTAPSPRPRSGSAASTSSRRPTSTSPSTTRP